MAGLKHVVRFGDFQLDLRTHELRRNGRTLKLPDQSFHILAALIERPGQLIPREELQTRLWPAQTFVDFEHSLNKAVNRLREALEDSAGAPQYVETLPRLGYRFIAPVEPLNDDSSNPERDGVAIAPTPERLRSKLAIKAFAIVMAIALAISLAWRIGWRSRSIATIRSIAVLPLENLSADPTQDYFADAMTDALITNLGKIGPLRVISRTSAMQYKGVHKPLPQIARELNVDAVVEGTVLRSGDRVRITAQLVEARADRHLWAQTYEGNMRDVLGLQNEVASTIAAEVRIKLTPQQLQSMFRTARSVDPQAHEAYLQGRYLAQTGSINGYQRSISYFEMSIKKDSEQALAYIGLSDAYVELAHMLALPPQEAFPKAKAAALKALQIDNSLCDAHKALGNVSFLYDWDFPVAEREFLRAIELNPNSIDAHSDYADFLIAMGRFDDSIAERKRNLEIDPLSSLPVARLATGFYWSHRYDEAIVQARKVIEMDSNHVTGHLDLGLALEQKHEFSAAISEIEKAVQVSNNSMWMGFVGHTMALSGNRVGARKILAHFHQLSKRTYVSPWWPAIVYPDLGDKDQAFAWLEKCYQGREHDLVFSKVWPMFDNLRSDPRYHDLLRRVGLPE